MNTAVFGGTFDPVHKGHILIARHAAEEFGLSQLVILPNGNPPHKASAQITDFCHRYNMLCLAFADMDDVLISDFESEGGPRYSVDTMRHFRSVYGDDTYFIIGADSLRTIHLWHDYKTLLTENRIIVFDRGVDGALLETAKMYREFAREINISNMPVYDASSTQIRDSLAKGTLTYDILTDDVKAYIREHGLYGGQV